MDNEAPASQGPIPVDDPARPSFSSHAPMASGAKGSAPDGERTGVFTSLVKEDSDIAGLVAYSIYKQNKLDWLQAFETAKSRAPDEAELAAYIIGESTPRRLATYRHLAEATLAGKGPDVEGAMPTRSPYPRAKGGGGAVLGPSVLLTLGIVVVLLIVAIWLATHYAGGR